MAAHRRASSEDPSVLDGRCCWVAGDPIASTPARVGVGGRSDRVSTARSRAEGRWARRLVARPGGRETIESRIRGRGRLDDHDRIPSRHRRRPTVRAEPRCAFSAPLGHHGASRHELRVVAPHGTVQWRESARTFPRAQPNETPHPCGDLAARPRAGLHRSLVSSERYGSLRSPRGWPGPHDARVVCSPAGPGLLRSLPALGRAWGMLRRAPEPIGVPTRRAAREQLR